MKLEVSLVTLAVHYKIALYWFVTALIVFSLWAVFFWSTGFFAAMFSVLPLTFLCVGWLYPLLTCWAAAWKQRRSVGVATVSFCAPLLVLAAAILVAVPTIQGVNWALDRIWFFIKKDDFETIVTRASNDALAQDETKFFSELIGVRFTLDEGPPLRAAFPTPDGGFLNRWSGVVYDPTGAVLLATGIDPETGKSRAPEYVANLFGGIVEVCSPLGDSFYMCRFS